jgi:hypothetical protein
MCEGRNQIGFFAADQMIDCVPDFPHPSHAQLLKSMHVVLDRRAYRLIKYARSAAGPLRSTRTGALMLLDSLPKIHFGGGNRGAKTNRASLSSG